MTRYSLPDGSTLALPDGISPAERNRILAEARKRASAAAKAPPSYRTAPATTLSSLIPGALSAGFSGVRGVTDPGAWTPSFQAPARVPATRPGSPEAMYRTAPDPRLGPDPSALFARPRRVDPKAWAASMAPDSVLAPAPSSAPPSFLSVQQRPGAGGSVEVPAATEGELARAAFQSAVASNDVAGAMNAARALALWDDKQRDLWGNLMYSMNFPGQLVQGSMAAAGSPLPNSPAGFPEAPVTSAALGTALVPRVDPASRLQQMGAFEPASFDRQWQQALAGLPANERARVMMAAQSATGDNFSGFGPQAAGKIHQNARSSGPVGQFLDEAAALGFNTLTDPVQAVQTAASLTPPGALAKGVGLAAKVLPGVSRIARGVGLAADAAEAAVAAERVAGSLSNIDRLRRGMSATASIVDAAMAGTGAVAMAQSAAQQAQSGEYGRLGVTLPMLFLGAKGARDHGLAAAEHTTGYVPAGIREQRSRDAAITELVQGIGRIQQDARWMEAGATHEVDGRPVVYQRGPGGGKATWRELPGEDGKPGAKVSVTDGVTPRELKRPDRPGPVLTKEQQAAMDAGATHWVNGTGVVMAEGPDGGQPRWRYVNADGTVGARARLERGQEPVTLGQPDYVRLRDANGAPIDGQDSKAPPRPSDAVIPEATLALVHSTLQRAFGGADVRFVGEGVQGPDGVLVQSSDARWVVGNRKTGRTFEVVMTDSIPVDIDAMRRGHPDYKPGLHAVPAVWDPQTRRTATSEGLLTLATGASPAQMERGIIHDAFHVALRAIASDNEVHAVMTRAANDIAKRWDTLEPEVRDAVAPFVENVNGKRRLNWTRLEDAARQEIWGVIEERASDMHMDHTLGMGSISARIREWASTILDATVGKVLGNQDAQARQFTRAIGADGFGREWLGRDAEWNAGIGGAQAYVEMPYQHMTMAGSDRMTDADGLQVDFAKRLEARNNWRIAELGGKPLNQMDAGERVEHGSRLAAEDVAAQIKRVNNSGLDADGKPVLDGNGNPVKPRNAALWYREFLHVLAMVSDRVPELRKGAVVGGRKLTGSTVRDVWTWATAITSNGNTVDFNHKMAEAVVGFWLENGRMPDIEAAAGKRWKDGTVFASGTSAKAMATAYRQWNADMLRFKGEEAYIKFLKTPIAEDDMVKMGLLPGVKGMDGYAHASNIYGPKIGTFVQNLWGNLRPFTIDRWMMKTWGRWFGSMIQSGDSQRATFREEMTKALAANPGLLAQYQTAAPDSYSHHLTSIEFKDGVLTGSDEAINYLAKAVAAKEAKNYEDAPDKAVYKATQRKQYELAGKNLATEVFTVRQDPDPAVRRELHAVVERARQILLEEYAGKPGYEGVENLSNADIQAILWYPEQEIWDKPENSVSYMDIEKQTRQQRGLPAMSEDQVSAIAKGFDNEDKDYASRERTGATGGYNRKEAAAAIRRRAISEIQKRPQLSRGGPGANGGVSKPGSAGGNSGNSNGVVRDPVAYVGEQAGPEDLARMAQPTREQQVAQAAGATHWWDGMGVRWTDGTASGWRPVFTDGKLGPILTIGKDKQPLPSGRIDVPHVPGLSIEVTRKWVPDRFLNDRLGTMQQGAMQLHNLLETDDVAGWAQAFYGAVADYADSNRFRASLGEALKTDPLALGDLIAKARDDLKAEAAGVRFSTSTGTLSGSPKAVRALAKIIAMADRAKGEHIKAISDPAEREAAQAKHLEERQPWVRDATAVWALSASLPGVTVKEFGDYQRMKASGGKFVVSEDGGFFAAIDGDELVSVLKHPGSQLGNAGVTAATWAMENGARILDAYDAHIAWQYAQAGWKVVARTPWVDEFAPPGWDYDYWKQWHPNGTPDVVLMVPDVNAEAVHRPPIYDDNGDVVRPGSGVPAKDYTAAENAARSEIASIQYDPSHGPNPVLKPDSARKSKPQYAIVRRETRDGSAPMAPHEYTQAEFRRVRPAVPGYLYHGSPTGDLSGPVDTYGGNTNREGIGFFTTDSREAAQMYADGRTAKGDVKANAPFNGRVNYVRGEVTKPLQMDAPADPTLWHSVAAEMGYDGWQMETERAGRPATNGDAYRQLIVDYGTDMGGVSEAQYAVDETLHFNERFGYDAIQHQEGKLGTPHNVTVYRGENRPEIVRPEVVHRQVVEQALRDGLDVPDHVAKDYPDLAGAAGQRGPVDVQPAADEWGSPDPAADSAVRRIAAARGIGVTRDRDLATVARGGNGEIVGGTFTAYDHQTGTYTFDVVVDKASENRGVGSALLDSVIELPDDIREMNPDATVRADVVSPAMRRMLERRGFRVTRRLHGDRVIMEPQRQVYGAGPQYAIVPAAGGDRQVPGNWRRQRGEVEVDENGVPKEDQGAEFAANLNLDYVDAPEGTKDLLTMLAAGQSQRVEGRRRGIMTFDEIRGAAEVLGVTPKQVVGMARKRAGMPLNAEQIVAVRDALVTQAQKYRDLRAAADQSGDPMHRAEATQAMLDLATMQRVVAGATAEAGRALAAHRILARAVTDLTTMPESERTRAYGTLMNLMDGLVPEDVADKLNALDAHDVVGMNRLIAEYTKFPFANQVQSWITSSLLSAPRGLLRDAMANTLWGVTENLVTRPLEAVVLTAVAKARGQEPSMTVGDAMLGARGWFGGAGAGAREAWDILRYGSTQEEMLHMDAPTNYRFSGPLSVINKPHDARGAGDAIFRSMSANAEGEVAIAQLARRAASAGKLLDGSTMEGFADQLRMLGRLDKVSAIRAAQAGALDGSLPKGTDRLVRELHDRMEAAGRRGTFTDEPDAALRGIMTALNHPVPGLGFAPQRILIPFVRVPYNIIKRGLEYSPLGAVRLLQKENRGEAAAGIAVRAVIGSAIMGSLVQKALLGELTGVEPDTEEGRDQWQREGKTPWSVKVGDAWIPYWQIGPLGYPMAMAAGLAARNYSVRGEEADSNAALESIAMTARFMRDQTFAQGLKQIDEAVNNPSRAGSTWLKGVIQSFVPFSAGVRNVAQVVDPTMRKAGTDQDFGGGLSGFGRSLYERMRKDTPIASQGLPAAVSGLGVDVQRPGGRLGALSPLGYSTDASARTRPGRSLPEKARQEQAVVSAALGKAGMALGLAPRKVTIGGQSVALNPSEYREAQQQYGDILRPILYGIVSQKTWPGLPKGTQRKILVEVTSQVREKASPLFDAIAARRLGSAPVGSTGDEYGLVAGAR